jgi:hypothetical protein
MPGHEPAHRSRPVQVAKRKQKPLGQEDAVVKKRSKTKIEAAEENETSNALDEKEEPKMFISPEKYLDKAKVSDEDEEPRVFVSPLKYMSLANEDDSRPRAKHQTLSKKGGNQESSFKHRTRTKGPGKKKSSTRPLDNKLSSSQQPPHVEKSTEPPVDRFVTSAQEDLMQMIEEGASDKAIDNQMKIIKMLRARLPSQGKSILFPGGLPY